MTKRRLLTKLANGCAAIGLLLLLASLYLRVTLPPGEFRSLGTVGSYSLMESRDGILFGNHVRVWHRLNLVYPALLLITPAALGLLAVRARRREKSV